MDGRKDTAVEALLEHLIEHGPDDIATVSGRAFDLAMQLERERFLRAGPCERTAERRGYANGCKPKRIDTPAGTVTVDVPETAGHEGAPFHPQSPERGRRSVRAVMLAVAEMSITGVSTREVEAVMREFGIESLSSSQVSRAAKMLDDEPEAWRNRPPGQVRYLVLDARYGKMRHGGVVRDGEEDQETIRWIGSPTNVLSAIGVGPDERRRVLGVSVALSEAEVHWRTFLESLQARGLRGVEYVVSDDHAGLRAVWNAASLAKAETALAELVASYRNTAPKLAAWLQQSVPEGLAVFALTEPHRRRLRTSNPMARAVRQELKRRTVKVRVFPNDAALERRVSAVLVEIDEKWASHTKAYIKWGCQDA